ncbi:hypothetical protein [Streptomyces sp. 058-1L]|uniref:hypothetical protein n=1 Tax=Streptomyces sp. 058-1L TaxID=2789266 RepID=UPI00397FE06E
MINTRTSGLAVGVLLLTSAAGAVPAAAAALLSAPSVASVASVAPAHDDPPKIEDNLKIKLTGDNGAMGCVTLHGVVEDDEGSKVKDCGNHEAT